MTTNEAVVLRLNKLERQNRILTAFSSLAVCVILLAVVGWMPTQAKPKPLDLLRVRRLEVVDARGIPLVTIGPDRLAEGGMVTLRDKLGEKRSWWQAGPATAELTLSSEDAQGQNDNTLGFTVGPNLSKMLLIGKSSAILSAEMRQDGPHLDLWSDKGKSLFSAPWK